MINSELSKKMKTQYSLGYPFPHIIIDDFLPEMLLDKSMEELTKFEYFGDDPNNEEVQVKSIQLSLKK